MLATPAFIGFTCNLAFGVGQQPIHKERTHRAPIPAAGMPCAWPATAEFRCWQAVDAGPHGLPPTPSHGRAETWLSSGPEHTFKACRQSCVLGAIASSLFSNERGEPAH